jgi:hypothetical protein
VNQTPATTADNGGSFSTQQAAALLTQTTQQTRRQIEPSPPWLLAIRAIGILAVGYAAWLSVRGQHPYKGPTSSVIPAFIAFGVINFLATTAMRRHATAGVSGRSRLHPAEIAILAAAWIIPYALMVPLASGGASNSFVYGVYPTGVPLLAAGLVWAAVSARRTQWRACGIGLAVAAVGAVDLVVGPVDTWLSMGIGLCAVLLTGAAVIIWQQHHRSVQP